MYKLEYWVDKRNYSKEDLESKLSQNLGKLDTEVTVKAESDYYLVIIDADKRNIDACHDHLSFNRDEIFLAKDELGDELRSKAYPLLAEIETQLRRFITRAMIEVLDFNWWGRSTPNSIQENVDEVERKAGTKQAQEHHQIEFTKFVDLISFVTGKYQKWSDTKNLTPADLAELLDDCENIEELKQKLSQNREQTSLWEGVFSSYFDDPKGWKELEGNIEETVISIRNKVMHHRRIRIHHLRQLKESRDELLQIIGTAKSELPQAGLENAAKNIKAAVENMRFNIDPELVKALSQPITTEEILQNFPNPFIDPEILKALQEPIIDAERLRRIMSGFKVGLQDFDDDSTLEEEDNDSNEDERNEQDQEENNTDNDADDEDE